MRDHVLGQLKQMAEKCACSDVTDAGNAYDLISNLIYCVDIIATEMPSKEQMQLLETETERARFERWVKSETSIGNVRRNSNDPTCYDSYEVELAWTAWQRSRMFESR